jgi:hypothetical protein
MKNKFEGHRSFIEFTEDGETSVRRIYEDTPEAADLLLYDAAYMICFADCNDLMIKISRIVVQGFEVKYAGWQPDMLFEFYDCASGVTIWSRTFPNWEH